MKSLILSTVAAAALALSAGTAFASSADYPIGTDNGFAVYQQDQKVVPHRAFLAGSESYATGTDNGFAAYQQDQRVSAHRAYLSGGSNYPIGTDNGFAVYQDDLKRQGR